MTVFLKIENGKKNNSLIISLFLVCIAVIGNIETKSQNISIDNDLLEKSNLKTELPKVKTHSAKRAALYSAILPGLGQAYNKKYWKIPIIYAGVGTLAYFVVLNKKEYNKFRDAYIYVSSGDSSYTNNDYVDKYSEASLLEGRNYYRSNLELTYILSGVLYLLNIIDATVDAHLFEYDISDNLSMKLEPAYNRDMIFNRPSAGLKISLRF